MKKIMFAAVLAAVMAFSASAFAGQIIMDVFFASLKSPLLQNKFPRHRVGNFIPQIS